MAYVKKITKTFQNYREKINTSWHFTMRLFPMLHGRIGGPTPHWRYTTHVRQTQSTQSAGILQCRKINTNHLLLKMCQLVLKHGLGLHCFSALSFRTTSVVHLCRMCLPANLWDLTNTPSLGLIIVVVTLECSLKCLGMPSFSV